MNQANLISSAGNDTKNEQKQKLFIFNIDRGGTFTDFYVQQIELIEETINEQNIQEKSYKTKQEYVFKFPSQSSFGQGPIVGIKNFLKQQNLMQKDQHQIPTKNIFRINLGTTIATNALLQRKGTKNCMILTKGFKDLLTMRHLARPNIFDLICERKQPLFSEVIEADERVFLKEPPPQIETTKVQPEHMMDTTVYRKQLSEEQINRICKQVKSKGYQSVGISFCHSIADKENQERLKEGLIKENIPFVQSSSSIEELGYLKRSETTNVNVFLGPIMRQYFQEFVGNFTLKQQEKLDLKIMKSNGGFSTHDKVKSSQILLSGPAGGLIGYSSMIPMFEQISGIPIKNLIGLDMGGTSTDISRVEDKEFKILQTSEIESVFVCSPHLEIDTIAAGGGSKLYYENGMFKVGPESVGSRPGPVCYGYGNELALTDANFLLNRIDSTYFPKIFGKNNDQGLNIDSTRAAFNKLCQEINSSQQQQESTYLQKSPQEAAQGFITIANQLMARSARKFFTFGNPDAFVIFGSAGGQHCCQLAQTLDISHLFIHRYSGILSAYGLSKAPQTVQKKIHLGLKTTREQFNFSEFQQRINKIIESVQSDMDEQYNQRKIYIMMGYNGTNYQITIQLQKNLIQQFQRLHLKDNGFVLPGKEYRIQYLVIKTFKYPSSYSEQKQVLKPQEINDFLTKKDKVFLNGQWLLIPFYDITEVKKSHINGPAMLISKTATILVKLNWKAYIQGNCIYLKRQKNLHHLITKNIHQQACDPITLTLYSTRLMSIAEEMGKVLERISISTNIKQRLDFSCGIFDWNGKVLANAPHIPVHLGSMQTAVKQQIKRGIKSGQSILTNHPIAGGSHLPDLTVVTCVQIQEGFRIFVASRGHHADIGGISPGSMPPFSKFLSQQGLAVEKYELTDQKGHFRQQQTRQLFKESRKIDDNISDLLAQLAANKIGIKLLTRFIQEESIQRFKKYVGYICENASSCVQKLLVDFSLRNGFKEVGSVENCEFMDDGTELRLKLTIDRVERKAVFDFTGTGEQILGNTNAPYSITRSAILYSLRSLIGKDIPLNSGCLQPIQIIVPQQTILSPSKNSAVVGGNVETSQRIVDLILKPFKVVAASQGTMNNFLFGNDKISYYETIGGGSGAGQKFNGRTCQVHMTNTRITDVEHLEQKYPVILKQFGIRKASGGKGKYCGGDGVVREFVFLEPLEVSILSERRVFRPYGLEGGKQGERGKNLFAKYSESQKVTRSLGSKNVVNVEKFDVIRIQTPGGGGFGKRKQQQSQK